MAWGLLEDEDQLKLDPALADFVRQRTGAPPAVPAQEAAPMPGVGPSPQDAAAMAELEKLAAKDERTQSLGYLGGLLSDAGALMRGKDRPFRAPPQVDDSIRKFIISRKMQDPQAAELRNLDIELKRKALAGQPKAIPLADGPATEAQRAELRALGRNPDAYPTAGYAQQAIVAAQNKPVYPDVDEATRQEIESRGYSAAGMKAPEATKFLADLKAREVQDAARKQEMERKSATDEREAGRKEDKTKLGNDWEIGPNSPLSDPAKVSMASAFLNSSTDARQLNRNVDELKALVGPNPSSVLTDSNKLTRARSIVAQIRLAIKNIMQLGVIAGPDMPQFIDPQISDPAEWSAQFQSALGRKDFLAQFDQLKKSMTDNVITRAQALDVRPKAGGYYEPFFRSGGAGGAGPSVVERRKMADGRVLEKLSDGTIREVK